MKEWTIFLSELVGTSTLVLLGGGVVANSLLNKTKGHGTKWGLITLGWGFSLFCAIFVSVASGGHLNPAVTLAKIFAGNGEFAPGVKITWGIFMIYIVGQFLGAFFGSIIMWLVYKKQFDATEDPATKLGVFSTGPEIRSYGWNVLTETIGTFFLIFIIFNLPAGLETWQTALAVAFILVAIGAGVGGSTGYALNPARDLGPRIAYTILPIKNKGGSDWSYAWVPVVGPLLGGLLAGMIVPLFVAVMP